MKKLPIVSVVMITYGHQKFIKEAVNGVLKQKSHFEIELILANDASPDKTDEVVKEIIKSNPRASIINYIKHNKNIGMMPNFVLALQKCKGKYIALCDGDDYWTDSHKLQKHVDVMENNTDIVLTYHDSGIIDSTGKLIKPGHLYEARKRDFSSDELKTGVWILTQTMCFRNVIRNYNNWLLKVYNGDNVLTSLLGNYGRGVYLGDIEPSMYRIHESGVFSMKSDQEKKLRSIRTPLLLMLHYYKINDYKFYVFFKKRSQNMLNDIVKCKISYKEKITVLKIILFNMKHLGFKNSIYYLRIMISS